MSALVEAIVRLRQRKGHMEFLVKWKGYTDKDNTWEPVENLQNCKLLVQEYLQKPRNTKKHARLQMQAGLDPFATLDRVAMVGQVGKVGDELIEGNLPGKSTQTEGTPGRSVQQMNGHGQQQQQDSDDADIEDAENRCFGIERSSLRRRRRVKPVHQDTTESEEDVSEMNHRSRWNSRTSPHHDTKLHGEETASRVRPLCVWGNAVPFSSVGHCGTVTLTRVAPWRRCLVPSACFLVLALILSLVYLLPPII
uniref:chromo domain-containing protein rhino-like isoform X2 n=1 Tax=Myxine glutinosa TaxID=7769 RepID=UPI00358ED585